MKFEEKLEKVAAMDYNEKDKARLVMILQIIHHWDQRKANKLLNKVIKTYGVI